MSAPNYAELAATLLRRAAPVPGRALAPTARDITTIELALVRLRRRRLLRRAGFGLAAFVAAAVAWLSRQ